ncbi:WecB/TagA/CpsF family glycosyltransferase [Paraferrimonas sedimenticola]|uniref:Alpha-1,3-mannosyltransferase n=1 Tax=Paraferrimonas sedimenticola TaxID=375674 RepID=A0AA37RVM6_9GAMM|nr:WecB/TagA/CpsF family glycosyltransferase [Paraferrimonas sedimenticola]GLP96023.1 hypothetical protein GCM10007895_13290 [Paraferrimonas sedimenticola]
MKVIHIVRQFAPALGGLENFVRSLALEQIKLGFEVKVITLNKVFHDSGEVLPASETLDEIQVVRVPYKGSYKYPIAPQVLEHLHDGDLIHVHGIDFFVDYLSLKRWSINKPMVVSTHGGFFHTGFVKPLKQLFFHTVSRCSLTAFDAVVACSVNDYQIFESVCEKRLQLIENGVDTEKFANRASQQMTKRFLFIGRFSDNKRIDWLIEVFQFLCQMDTDYQLEIVGKDWDNNEQDLRLSIQLKGLDQNVRIHTELSDEAIAELVEQSSFVVSASAYEGFGMTIIEGMAAGLQPVTSDIASFQRILNQAQLGLIVDFEDRESAAWHIHNYCNNLAPDYQQARAAAIAAANVYAWPTVAQHFSEVYKPLLSRQDKVIQGVRLADYTKQNFRALLDEGLNEGERRIVAFANAHTINLAQKDPNYRRVLNSVTVVNDGVGMKLASTMKYGRGFVENLNGTDFVPYYLANSEKTVKVFLVGAREEVVKRCFDIWRSQYSQHQWVGYQHGYFKAEDTEQVCSRIKAANADLVIVAMGNPMQELWLDQHLEKTGASIGIGVGGLFDFTAGAVKRAPQWVQRFGLEWFYRLIQEPKRMWRRYLVGNAVFLFHAWRDSR